MTVSVYGLRFQIYGRYKLLNVYIRNEAPSIDSHRLKWKAIVCL